jgi:N-acyl-L-homoserine lactone synthetase
MSFDYTHTPHLLFQTMYNVLKQRKENVAKLIIELNRYAVDT